MGCRGLRCLHRIFSIFQAYHHYVLMLSVRPVSRWNENTLINLLQKERNADGQTSELHDLMKTSKPLSLGHYILEETKAPRGYSREISAESEVTGRNEKSIHDIYLDQQYRTKLYEA